MTLATDAGSRPDLGVFRYANPVHGCDPAWAGFTAMQPGPFKVPVLGDFTINTALTGYVVTQHIDRITVTVPSASQQGLWLLRPIINPPYMIEMIGTMQGCPDNTGGNNSSLSFGLGISDGTQFSDIGVVFNGTKYGAGVSYWNTNSGINSSPSSTKAAFNPAFCGTKITHNGSTRRYLFAPNGKDYAEVWHEPAGTFLTETQIGLAFYVGLSNPANTPAKFSVYHYAAYGDVAIDAP